MNGKQLVTADNPWVLKRGPKGPSKPLDPSQVKDLAGIGCTMDEMAKILKVSVDTLRSNYSDVIDEARATLKMSVRRTILRQFEETGNTVAMRYLIHRVLKESIEDPKVVALLKSREVDALSLNEMKQIVHDHFFKSLPEANKGEPEGTNGAD